MDKFEVRCMQKGDIYNGFLDILSEGFSACGLTEFDALGIYEYRMRYGMRTIVAVVPDGEVIGTATLLMELKYLHGGGAVGHIEDIAVKLEWRGCGVGVKLVEKLIETCKIHRCYKVILDCKEENVGFYEKLGFQRWEQAMRLDM